jgi:hypothetical protein
MAAATLKFILSPKLTPPFGSKLDNMLVLTGTITFSAAGDTYTTGGIAPLTGFALTNLAPYGNRTALAIYVQSSNGSGWNYQYNITSNKLQLFASAAGSGTAADGEATNGTALNGFSPNVFTDTVTFIAFLPMSIS